MALELRNLQAQPPAVMTPQHSRRSALQPVAARTAAGGAESWRSILRRGDQARNQRGNGRGGGPAAEVLHPPTPRRGPHRRKATASSTAWTGSTTSTKAPATDAWIDTDDEDGRPLLPRTPLTRRPGLTEHLETAAAAPGHHRTRARSRPSTWSATSMKNGVSENDGRGSRAGPLASAVEEVSALSRRSRRSIPGSARGPAECLMIQAGKGRGVRSSPPDPRDHFDLFSRGRGGNRASAQAPEGCRQGGVPEARHPVPKARPRILGRRRPDTSPPTSTCSKSTIKGHHPERRRSAPASPLSYYRRAADGRRRGAPEGGWEFLKAEGQRGAVFIKRHGAAQAHQRQGRGEHRKLQPTS